MPENVFIINILLIIILFTGIIMTVIGLPGNFLIVVSALVYGYYDNFEHIHYTLVFVIVAAFIVGELIEFISGMLGAKKENASKRAVFAALIGTVLGGIVGTTVLPVVGSFLGALLGAYVLTAAAEYTKTKNTVQAKRVAKSVIKGQFTAMIIKVTVAIGMVISIVYQLPWR